MTRGFDAPRRLVFHAYTDPNVIPHGWGPRIFTTTVDKMDVKPGGLWRFVQRGPDGAEYAFNGEYREIVPRKRLVYTFEFEGMPGHVLLETVTFEEHAGKTTVKVRALFDSVEGRDGMLQSGMEDGAAATRHQRDLDSPDGFGAEANAVLQWHDGLHFGLALPEPAVFLVESRDGSLKTVRGARLRLFDARF